MTTSPQDREHAERIRQTLLRRLRELEVQAATYGPSTPPHILIDIDDVKSKLSAVEPLAQNVTDPQILALLRRYDQLDLLTGFLTDQGKRLRVVETGLIDLSNEVRQWFAKRDEQVRQDEEKREIRQRRQDITLGAIIACIILFGAAIGVLVIMALNNG
jgi:hypothetical protein